MEELQALWYKASAGEKTQVSKEEIDTIVSHSSSDELAKFRQVIYLEYVASWLVLPILLVGVFSMYRLLCGTLLVGTIYLLYFYREALRQFDEIHYEDSIRNYLQKALGFVKVYVRHYKIIYWVAGGIGLLVGCFGGYYAEELKAYQLTKFPALGMVMISGGVILAILFAHFYIKYLYQARIDKLEALLQEFSED